MKPLRLLQRRIIATNLAFVLLLLFGILTALFLNARARSLKEAGRYLGAELRFASAFPAHEAESGKPDSDTAPPYGERMQQTYYPYVIFSKNETDGSYTVSTAQDLSLSDTDTARLQSLLQEIAGKDTDTAQTEPPEKPEESEHLTPAFSS